jgi:hypothetical protein
MALNGVAQIGAQLHERVAFREESWLKESEQ